MTMATRNFFVEVFTQHTIALNFSKFFTAAYLDARTFPKIII